MKTYTFPLDGKKFTEKAKLLEHINENYPHMLNDDMSAKRLYFNLKNKKVEGKCVISGKPTKFNEETEKYERFHSDREKELYRKQFTERMVNSYGKVHLLDSPERQKMMLDSRKISMEYKWLNGKITTVTSKYEYDFLAYVESHFKLTYDTFAPPPTFYYKDDSVERFYLPDFFIPSLNLIIEVKGTNNHYQARDKYKEELKKKAVLLKKFNFIQINDKDYSEFNNFYKKHVLES